MGDNMIGFQRLAQNQYISPDLLVILKLFFKGFQRLTLQSTLFPGLPVIKLSPFCNLQSWARTHAVLVIGLYELLGNPTT
jgi:hypothetical protein